MELFDLMHLNYPYVMFGHQWFIRKYIWTHRYKISRLATFLAWNIYISYYFINMLQKIIHSY